MEKYEYTKAAARELCRGMGVEWDEKATEPTLRGKPLTAEAVADMFPEGRKPLPEED